MQAWAAIGEQQRMVEAPPSEFAVFGTDAVMAAGVWGVAEGDYVIIRDLMLVEAFTALFDLAWSTGLPVPDAASTSESDRRLLALLSRGYKDEAIARYLGWGVRTVRRRVSALMDALGADTRFQLGVAAQQRGLLEVEGASTGSRRRPGADPALTGADRALVRPRPGRAVNLWSHEPRAPERRGSSHDVTGGIRARRAAPMTTMRGREPRCRRSCWSEPSGAMRARARRPTCWAAASTTS